jgi:hypothetical protein
MMLSPANRCRWFARFTDWDCRKKKSYIGKVLTPSLAYFSDYTHFVRYSQPAHSESEFGRIPVDVNLTVANSEPHRTAAPKKGR